MMEKNGEIRQGLTPPEDDEKKASADLEVLEEHVTKRAANRASECCKGLAECEER